MIFLIHAASPDPGIGGKATQLAKLESLGFRVPKWTAIPAKVVQAQLPTTSSISELSVHFAQLEVPSTLLTQLRIFFGEDAEHKTFAVRSSALDEDGDTHSFAGQFETYLHVPFAELSEKIKLIWQSAVSERVLAYRKLQGLELELGIGVIIQEMIEPEVAGVGFGMDPVSGDRDTQVISAVWGLGEGLVSGKLDADTFRISSAGVEERIVAKTAQFRRNESGKGVKSVSVEAERHLAPTLSGEQLQEVSSVLKTLEAKLGGPQDIEFGYAKGELYLLQTRPVTGSGSGSGSEDKPYMLWDNSNIVESYPGITTPLTFSFIQKMYERVYRQLAELMGVREADMDLHSGVFAQTLGLVRGRVYYNLLNWYKMLALVPGYTLNAPFMENMMGVKERFELGPEFRMHKGKAGFRILKMVAKLVRLHRNLPASRRSFMQQLNATMDRYAKLELDTLSASELIQQYQEFETTLLLKWKAPLVNDFFAMIWFGLLQKFITQLFPSEPNLHNDLLCGSQDIISVEPIHRSIAIANLIRQNPEALQLFQSAIPANIWAQLNSDATLGRIKAAIVAYLDRFGERCVGELKLETVSYSQEPSRFVQVLKSYVIQGVTQKRGPQNLENKLRIHAEQKVLAALAGKPLKRAWFHKLVKNTRDLVSNRENLRYERTRGFGMVRRLFTALGKKWHQSGHLADPRDIFYLELAEIKAASDGNFPAAYAQRIINRKQEFTRYRQQPAPQERFFTYGTTFSDAFIYSDEKLATVQGELSGIGCCPGRVQGRVRIVTDPQEVDSLDGDILVTSSTDPGWVTLFPTAGAIIVERGSLLSHSAIVSREMGIPCIVSVTGLLRSLKTGDEIVMDGSTGQIKRIIS